MLKNRSGSDGNLHLLLMKWKDVKKEGTVGIMEGPRRIAVVTAYLLILPLGE
jgi:hypothetical protein